MARVDTYVELDPVTSAVVRIVVHTNCAREAYCAATIIPQHVTLFALDQYGDLPGVYVSISV